MRILNSAMQHSAYHSHSNSALKLSHGVGARNNLAGSHGQLPIFVYKYRYAEIDAIDTTEPSGVSYIGPGVYAD